MSKKTLKLTLTFRTQNELIVLGYSTSLKIPLKKYLKYILISPYMRTKGIYQNIGSPLDFLKTQNIEKYNLIMKKYGHMIIDKDFLLIKDMENSDISKYINIQAWKELHRYEEFEKMLKSENFN